MARRSSAAPSRRQARRVSAAPAPAPDDRLALAEARNARDEAMRDLAAARDALQAANDEAARDRAQMLQMRSEYERIGKEREEASQARDDLREEVDRLTRRDDLKSADHARQTAEYRALAYQRECLQEDLRQARATILTQAAALAVAETALRGIQREAMAERRRRGTAPYIPDYFAQPLAGATTFIPEDE